MSKSGRVVVCLFTAVFLASLSYAAVSDRIQGELTNTRMVQIGGPVHQPASAESDIGRVDGRRLLPGVSLNFHPSAAQQKDLDKFIAELGELSQVSDPKAICRSLWNEPKRHREGEVVA